MQYEIRAMSFGEILDVGFRLLRNHFLLLVGIAILVQLPTQILAVLATQASQDPSLAVLLTMFFVALPLLVLSPLVTAAITHALGELYLGRETGIGSAFRVALSMLLPLVGTFLLAGLLILLGLLLLVIPGLYLMLSFILLTQVIVIERRYGPQAMRRSRELMRGNLLRALGITLLVAILTSVLGGALGFALGFVPLLGAVGNAIVQSIALAYSTAVFVVLYFDIRCRKEAFDLEHLARLVEEGGEPAPATAPTA